jgi:hypothetical protein
LLIPNNNKQIGKIPLPYVNITLVGGVTQTNTQAQYNNGFGTAYDKEQDNWLFMYNSNLFLAKLARNFRYAMKIMTPLVRIKQATLL